MSGITLAALPFHGWEVNARVLGGNLTMVDADGHEWNVNQLLSANNTALVADSQEKLKQCVEFVRVCARRKLIINKNKNIVMKCTSVMDGRKFNIVLNGVLLEEV